LAVGVVASKNATQFVATVFAAPVRPAGIFESAPEAAADGETEALAGADALGEEAAALAEAEDAGEAGGVEDVELDELHAASARQPAVAATATKLRGRMFTRAGSRRLDRFRFVSPPCSTSSVACAARSAEHSGSSLR
jgi:hypothetical protein